MIKSISALAVFVALGASVIALPGFAPVVKADEAVAFPKANRLAGSAVAGNCARQVWPAQAAATGGLANRSALASTTTSSAFTAGAKPGKAITAAPKSENIARAERDLIMWGC